MDEVSNNEVKRLTRYLRAVHDGDPWYGSSGKKLLANLSFEESLNKIRNSHSILDLILHISSWQTMAIKMLSGEGDFEVSPEFNFRDTKGADPDMLDKAMAEYQGTHEQLLELLDQQNDRILEQKVPGNREYNFYYMLHGILHHKVYHLGQIALLRK